MALQHISSEHNPHLLAMASAVDQSSFNAPPHILMSFFDRSSRPLAWRTGLPPAASRGLFDLPTKNAHSLHTAQRGRSNPADTVERIRYDMNDFIKSTVWANHDMLQIRPSGLHGRQQRALYVKAPSDDTLSNELPSWLAATSGELLHVHADGSTHMVLSLADATSAVERGWAMNDSLIGGGHDALPLAYVAVHTPRNAAELAEWKRLVLASVRYGTYPWTSMEIRRPEERL